MRLAPFVLLAVFAASAAAEDPARALATGRAAIDAGHYQQAIETMQNAIPDATAIADPQQKADALAAIHFYSALAFEQWGFDDKAREELREFFRFRSGNSTLDRAKFPKRFGELFDEVKTVAVTPAGEADLLFDSYYPGFNEFVHRAPRAMKLSEWNKSAAFVLLADHAEKREWGRLADDEARRAFIDRFRARRGGLIDFDNRVAFADENFGSETTRGSLTDRGRVFILLGKPARVYAAPLGMFALTRRTESRTSGTLERWVYFHPAGLKTPQVAFRFIDQQGYGSYVLQRDFDTIRALTEATKQLNATR
jgi:GWxTD domain-containing protein